MVSNDQDQRFSSDGPIDVSLGGLPDDQKQTLENGFKLPEVLPILPVQDLSLFPPHGAAHAAG